MRALAERVAIVTGAGSGIGRAVTRRFLAEGARVVAFDRAQPRLQALQDEIRDNDLVCVAGDVTSWDDNLQAVAAATERWGRLDCFVGNAGIHDGGRRLTDVTPETLMAAFDEIFAVNVKGYLLGIRAAAPQLAQHHGSIVLTLSTSSFYAGGGGVLYMASKHAGLGLVRALAYELAPRVRVNGVAPSGTATNIRIAAALTHSAPPPRRPSGNNLLGITLEPEDHAAAYVMLASEEARAMTGVVLHSDAGRGVTPPGFQGPTAP